MAETGAETLFGPGFEVGFHSLAAHSHLSQFDNSPACHQRRSLLRSRPPVLLPSNIVKRRYLDCFGPPLPVFVPEASLLAMQLVEQSFDFSGYYAPVPMFQSPDADHRACRPLCQPLVYAALEYDRVLPTHFNVRADFLVERAGYLNAVRFITKNVLAIQEAEGSAIEWSNQHLIVPLEETLQVKAGETVTISVDYPAGCQLQELLKSIRARRNNHRGSSKVFYSRCRAA